MTNFKHHPYIILHFDHHDPVTIQDQKVKWFNQGSKRSTTPSNSFWQRFKWSALSELKKTHQKTRCCQLICLSDTTCSCMWPLNCQITRWPGCWLRPCCMPKVCSYMFLHVLTLSRLVTGHPNHTTRRNPFECLSSEVWPIGQNSKIQSIGWQPCERLRQLPTHLQHKNHPERPAAFDSKVTDNSGQRTEPGTTWKIKFNSLYLKKYPTIK